MSTAVMSHRGAGRIARHNDLSVSDMTPLLVVDDDAELCELLTQYLEPEGFALECVHDGRVGLERAASGDHEIVVLDIMLPERSGLELLERLRKTSDLPVLMLTARGHDIDRIVGLEMGADDYLAKPFNPRELLARIRAIVRRSRVARKEQSDALRVGEVELHPTARSVLVNGEELTLTTAELELLYVLMKEAGRVVSRERLSLEVLGRRLTAQDRSLDVHMSNLRRKLNEAGYTGQIKTVRSQGYLFAIKAPA